MLHAKTLRSPHPHARIVAHRHHRRRAALPGVKAIVTAADFHDVPVGATIPMGEAGYDMWMVARINIARDKVFWVGQPVAVVAATTRISRAAALALIDVTYEPLPAVMSIDAAMAPGAPVIHEDVVTTGLDQPPLVPSNVCSRTVIERGGGLDVLQLEIGCRYRRHRCARSIPPIRATSNHRRWSPRSMRTASQPSGLSTQGQHTTEIMIARLLDRPQSRSRSVPIEIGGGFGGKIAIHGEAACVRLSELTGRPVKLVMTREEVLPGRLRTARRSPPHASRSQPTRDGKLTAIKGLYHMDAGGLPGLPPSLMMQASAALYQCPHLHLEGYDVVTNKPRTEAYRGPGGIQAYFAMEQAMDALVPKPRHRPARIPQEERHRHRLHHADRHADSRRSVSPRSSTPSASIPAGPTRLGEGRIPTRPRLRARLLARHVDDIGLPHLDRRVMAGRW